jgi:hypothetical protein
MNAKLLVAIFAASLGACGRQSAPVEAPAAQAEEATVHDGLDALGERFVKLALAVGVYDANFVDAYQGPAEWQEAATEKAAPLASLEEEAKALIAALDESAEASPRAALLRFQTIAALTRIQMAAGRTFEFDAETASLYDAVAPQYDVAEFDAALAEIEALVPGEGPLNERVDAFKSSLAIPKEKLRAVFDASIAECRKRTAAHFELPEGESFDLQFVTDKPWSGYNWYKGDFRSVIEINTDLPIFIDRAVDLGCHEGYPGHHTWHSLADREVLKEKGWIEYSVYPLFSPRSLLAEGAGNYGMELAFPGEEKLAFEREILFPLAGLDPAKAETLDALNKLIRKLNHADNYVAREYLDGRITRDQAVALIERYRLFSRERAEQRVRFIETYRGYVINYNLGRDLVARHIENAAARGEDAWAAFESLLVSPVTASGLDAGAP